MVSVQQHAPAAIYPGKQTVHLTGGWACHVAGLEECKISSSLRFHTGPSSPWSVSIPTELPVPHKQHIQEHK
jgi:hypothetical protein